MSDDQTQLAPSNEWKISYSLGDSFQSATLSNALLQTASGICVGRGVDAPDINIQETVLSRQHCRFYLNADQRLFLTDLGSQNGTFVNGSRLPPNQPQQLKPADQVRLATLDITINFPAAARNESEYAAVDSSQPMPVDDQTIIGNISLKQKTLEPRDQGRHVLDHNLFIERTMTFGARRPVTSLLIVLFLTIGSFFALQNPNIDTSYDSMLNPNDPIYPVYQDVVKEFGSDNITLIYFQHPDLFTAENLKVIDDVTYALKNLDIVEKVESLNTTLSIRDSEFGLELGPLIDYIPETAEELQKIKDNALYSPLLKKNQLSMDGRISTITVTLRATMNESEFNREAYRRIEETIQPLKAHFNNVFQIGAPRLNVDIEESMLDDLTMMIPLTVGTLVISIMIMLRTPVAAILPLVTSGLSIVWMFGFMGLADIPLNFLTAILPGLVIVIGSTEDTHMLSAYLQGLVKGNSDPRFPAIRFMAIHVGLPIFITSFTTIVGFLSNSISDISLLRSFAITSAFAMFANLIATILVLPLLLRFFGPRQSPINVDMNLTQGWFAKFLRILEQASDQHQKKIVGTVVITTALFAAAALQLTTSNDPMSFFKADNPIVKNAAQLHDNLAGMQVFFLTVEAAQGRDFKDPEELAKLQNIENFMVGQGIYDNILSINHFLNLVNREMHHGDPAYYTIPETRDLAEQYFMLFQRNDIERFISHDYRKANFVVRHNLSNSTDINAYLNELTQWITENLGTTNKIYLSSKNLMVNKAADSLFINQFWSLGLLILVIFLLMSLLYSSLTAGFVSLIPNIVPIVVMFGVMGLTGIPLNPATAIVAVIAIGIAIDDTIHILSTYNRECRIDGDQAAAAKRSIRAEAIPVISTSLSLAVGFSMLVFSRFHILTQFGLLSALTMLGAMFTDLLLTPILLKRFRLVSLWDVIALNVGKEVLTQSEIFTGMSPFQIKRAILMSQVKEYQPGTVLVEQNAIQPELYIVIEGEVEIVHHDGTHKKLINRLGLGEIFGESGYAGVASGVTIRVPKAGKLLKVVILDPDKVDTAMRLYPRLHSKLNRNINTILAQRLLETGKLLQHKVNA